MSVLTPVRRQAPNPSPSPVLRRNAPLDGLRTLAIGAVVLYHFHVGGFHGGFIGVNVFFALSGYLITTILLRERAATGRIRLGAFWVRRLIRLYPALIAVVVVGISLWWLIGSYGSNHLSAAAAATIALTYSGNFARGFAHLSQGVFAPTWSLATEEQFYLVWPLLLLAFLRLRRSFAIIGIGALAVASCLCGWLLYRPPSGSATPDLYFNPLLNVAPLLMGCMLAFIMTSERVRRALTSRLGTWLAWAGIAGIVAIAVFMPADWKASPLAFAIILPAVGLATCLFIAGTANRRSLVARAFSFRPVAWFGRNLSYSLYLWHMVCLGIVETLMTGPWRTPVALALAGATALASCLFVERPLLKLKNRFEPRRVSFAGVASTA